MKAIILGSGRIGRGFIAELMAANNVELVFFDISESFVKEMNHYKSYTIHTLGDESKKTTIDNVKSYVFNDAEVFAKEWSTADFIFTAVGGKNLVEVGKKIGEAFKFKTGNKQSNIIICENWITPVEDLREGIESQISEIEINDFNSITGVTQSVILTTGTGAPDPDQVTNPIDTWIQDQLYLPVNKNLFLGEVPKWKYVEFIDNFGDLLTQKIYTNNTSVATVSYLGYLIDQVYVSDAANHQEIAPILDGVYEEVNQILIDGLGIDKDSQLAFSKRAKEKYTDPDIVDLVIRIARDPMRKLGPDDRFIGPLTIAQKTGVVPRSIALGAAAALYFDFEGDETAVTLQKMRNEKGINYIYSEVCKIDPNGQIATWINEAVEVLKEKGWIK